MALRLSLIALLCCGVACSDDPVGTPADVGSPDAAAEGPADASVEAADAGPDAGPIADAAETDAAAPSEDAALAPDASIAREDAGPASDVGAGCDPRTVPPVTYCPGTGFVPDSPIESWKHTIATPLIVAQGSPRHRGEDSVVNPGQEQLLIGKFAYGLVDKDLKDEKVEVWAEFPCGQWQKLGEQQTSEEGQWGTVGGIEDDGGRVFFTVPAAQRLPLGSHRIKLLVKGDHSEANFWLHVWALGTHVVVSDIDGTITTRENDGLWTTFDPASVTARDQVKEMHDAWDSKGYRHVYLTARPEHMTNATRAWFESHGFPHGVFHLSQSTFGESGQAAIDYKNGYLLSLINGPGLVIDWAFGNKESDLDAYLGAGVAPDHIFLVEGEYTGDLKGSTMIPDYLAQPARVQCLSPVTQP